MKSRGEIDVQDARQRLLERYSKEEIDAIIQLYSSAYGDCGMSPQAVLVEIICDAMGRMNAFATDATERVAGEVGVFLRNVRKEAKNTGATKNTTGDGGMKRSIELDALGRKYVQATRQVIEGNDPVKWGKQIENYINQEIRKGEDVLLPTDDGHILLLTERSAYKLSDRHKQDVKTKVRDLLSDYEYEVKSRMAAHIDELVKVGRFEGHKNDYAGNHKNDIGEDGFNYYNAYFKDVDGKYYHVPITAGVNGNEETVYSIGNIQKRRYSTGLGSSSNGGAQKSGAVPSGDIIVYSVGESQVQNSMKEAFEKAKQGKDNFTAEQIARHEAAHEQINRGEIDVKAVKERLLKRYSPEEIDAIIQLYSSAYGDCGMSPQEVLVEIICDAMGRMNAFATDATERVAGEVGVFLRNVRKATKEAKVETTKNTTGDGGVKYSIQFTKDMSWEEQLRAKRKGSLRTSDSFYLGMTPDVYGDEFSGYPLVMNQSDFKKSATEKHNVPNRVFKRLPGLLSNPVMSFYQDGRTAVVLDDIDADGKPLVAALHSGEQMDRKTVTAVTSVYGIDNWNSWISNQAKKKITIHNEIRAESMLQTYGSNASVEDAIRSTMGIVSQNEGGVKQKYSREMDTVKALERQKKLLKDMTEQRDYWKDQTRLTKVAKADKDAVRKLGREILREYSSSTKVDEILTDLQWLADDAAGKGNASFQELTEAAEKIARQVLEGSGVDVNGK